MPRNMLFGFGLLLAVIAVVLWARQEQAAPVVELDAPAPASDTSASAFPTAATIAAQNKAVSAMEAQQRMDPEWMKAEGKRLMQETERKMEAIWAKDAPDAAAAARTEQDIAVALASDIVQESRWQPDATQYSCRASMCRIESEFDAGASGGDWTARFLAQMGGRTFGNSTMVTLPGAEGKQQVVVYAFRPGRDPRR